MTITEDRIRNVLANQAAAMRVPEATSADDFARVIELPTPHRRPRVLVAAAAAGLLLAAGFAVAQRRSDDSASEAPGTATSFHFDTPTVLLDAASVDVTVAGKSFVPPSDVVVEGDPGLGNDYTTLELTWHDQGVEQRIYVYFTSDGTNWWANQINTYDGQVNGDWVEQHGEFFKSPLGTAYAGDLDLPNLKIHGMHVEAFRRPSACDSQTGPLALIANYPKIDSFVGRYGATLKLVDTATCQPVAVSGYAFDYRSDDPAVATVTSPQLAIPDYPPTLTRVDLTLVSSGSTVIHVVATDQAGTVVGTAEMQITVRPGDSATTGDTGVPVPTTVPADLANVVGTALAVPTATSKPWASNPWGL